MIFVIVTILCKHHECLIPEYSHHLKKKLPVCIQSQFFPPSSPWKPLIYLVSLYGFDFSFKWNIKCVASSV